MKAIRQTRTDVADSRKATISGLMLTGHSVRGIAEKTGIDKTTVHELMGDIRREWREQRITNTSELIAQELEQINAISRAAWEGWLRSLRTERTTKQKSANDKDGNDLKSVETTERDQAGDNGFLLTLAKCSDMRSKLQGLYPQTGVAITVGMRGGVGGDDGDDGTGGGPAKPLFVVMANHQDVAEWNELREKMQSNGYDGRRVVDGKLVEEVGTNGAGGNSDGQA